MLLANDVVERPRSQPGSQRSMAAQVLLRRFGEQIAHGLPSIRWYASRRKSTTCSISHCGSTHRQSTNSLPSGVGVTSSPTTSKKNHFCTWPRLRPSRPCTSITGAGHSYATHSGDWYATTTSPSPSPVSSFNSRQAAASGSSPRCIPPCGSCQLPLASTRSNASTSRPFGCRTTITTPARKYWLLTCLTVAPTPRLTTHAPPTGASSQTLLLTGPFDDLRPSEGRQLTNGWLKGRGSGGWCCRSRHHSCSK